MKRVFKFAIIVMCCMLLSCTAFAVSVDEIINVSELENAQPEAAQDAFGTMKADELSDPQQMLGKLWKYLSSQSANLLESALHNGASILAVSFFSAFCCSIIDTKAMSVIGAISVALVSIQSVLSCNAVGGRALQTLADYSHVLLPCLSTAAAASGAWTSAGVKYSAATLVMDMMITAEQNIVAPFLYSYASAAIAAQLTDQPLLMSVSGIMRQMMKWGLVLLTMGFVFYLSISGLLSGTVDAAAAKAAKAVVSGALPVVGGILSDASGAILSGVQMLRNGIGLIGMLAILAVCVSPYLTLGSHFLIYQICSGITASLGEKRIGNVIRCIGDVYGFLLGIVGSVSVMLFVSVISFMKAVSPG